MNRKVVVSVAVGVIVAIGVVAAIVFRSVPAPTPSSALAAAPVLRTVSGADPQSIDPARLIDTESSWFVSAAFAPLNLVDAQGGLRPVLAERSEMAADGRSATVQIAPNAAFSDGTPVTAEDVRFTFERLQQAGHPQRYVVERIRGIAAADPSKGQHAAGLTVVDARTLRIEFDKPDPDFFRLTANAFCGIVKRGSDTLAKRPLDSHLIGAGPFTLTDLDPGRRYTFKANPGFPTPTGASGLTIDIVESDRDVLTRLTARSLDLARVRGSMLSEIFEPDRATLTARPAFAAMTTVARPAENLVFLRINWSAPAFAGVAPDGRGAWADRLSAAVDRAAIAKSIYLGTATPAADALQSPAAPFTRPAAAPTVGGPDNFELLVPAVGELQRVSDSLTAQFRGHGLSVPVRTLGVSEAINRLVKQEYAVSLIWLESNVASDLAWPTFFSPTRGGLFGSPVNGIDAALDDARGQTDVAARRRELDALTRTINAGQNSWVPIVRRQTVFLASPDVTEIGIDGNGVPQLSLLRVKPAKASL